LGKKGFWKDICPVHVLIGNWYVFSCCDIFASQLGYEEAVHNAPQIISRRGGSMRVPFPEFPFSAKKIITS